MKVAKLALCLLVVGVFALIVRATAPFVTPVQAQTACSSGTVNTQFRQSAAAETPWVHGAVFAPAQNSFIDVNCFMTASNGTVSLLSTGRITATVVTPQGQTVNLTQSSWGNTLRDYRLTQAGTYTFRCANSANSCADSDTFTVAATAQVTPTPAAQVTPTPAAQVTPTPAATVSTCNSISIDGNKTPTVGTRIQFRCNGPSNATSYFFAYRRSTSEGMQPLAVASGNLSAELEVSPFLQVQCNPCIGTTCATATNVNAQCTYTKDQSVSPTPGAGSVADLNKDGKVDINDYKLFLEEYLKFVQ